jgi:hypothetical protein
MARPIIIIAEETPGRYTVSVIGRFGGGFSGARFSREALIARLGLLKSYDCGDLPATVICPASVEAEFRAVFPDSFADA